MVIKIDWRILQERVVGMFVIKQAMEMQNKTFRLPMDLLERLTSLAESREISVNNLVCQCCEYALGISRFSQ